MVLTVDYNSVFQDNKNVVEKSKHYLDFAGTLIGYIYYRIKSSDVMSSIADKTFSQFLQTKGIIADLHERIEKNKTQEFNVNVVAVKDLLDMNIQLLDGIEKFSFEHP